jgi:hypothetical protein
MSASKTPEQPRCYKLIVPGHPLSANGRRRSHWATIARDARQYREAVAWLAREQIVGPPLERAHVVATVVQARGRLYDTDALGTLAKPCVDGLVGIMLVDDSPRHIDLELKQERGPLRLVRLEITEVALDYEPLQP